MTEFFVSVVNMSISAGWIVLAVLLLRVLLKKAPKWITVLLWGIVAVRLICPFTIESALSLIPSAQTINPEVVLNQPTIDSGVPVIDNIVNPVVGGTTISFQPEKDLNFFKFIMPYLAGLWLVGIAALLIYTYVSYARLKRKISTAVLLRDNIFQSETVVSPFVLGIIKPKIYLPFNMNEQDMEHVIAHENAHIHRKDHWWKPVGFLILTFHWFNPLMWIGYVLLCRDIELACDEKVIKELNAEQKADYSQALLTCSVNRRVIAACPLAFGEVDVRNRVKSILNYKKPAFWIIVVAVAASVAVAVCFLTNPRTTIDDELSVFLDMQIAEHHYSEEHTDDNFIVTHHKVLGVDKSLKETTVYMWVLYHEYSYENGEIKLEAGAHIPTVITAKRTGSHGHYELVEYWEPRDGSYYAKDIKEKFPWHLHGKALDSQRYIGEQKAFCENAAKEYFREDTDFVGGPTNIGQLKEKYPQFFNVSTDGGLTVYVWQMSKDNYSCYLANTSMEAISDNSFAYDVGTTIAEMRAILTTHNIDQKEITVQPVINPLSSYYYEIDDTYRAKVKELFWATIPYADSSQYSTFIDTANFDIDGDGKEEQCALSAGPTSGLFTFIFSVSENGNLEYFNVFNSPYTELKFKKNAEGKMLLVGKSGEKTCYMGMDISDGNIVLSSDEQEVSYWGEQGLNSPYAPKIASDLNNAITKVLNEKYSAEKPDGLIHVENYYLLSLETASGTPLKGNSGHMKITNVYLLVYHMKYSVNAG